MAVTCILDVYLEFSFILWVASFEFRIVVDDEHRSNLLFMADRWCARHPPFTTIMIVLLLLLPHFDLLDLMAVVVVT